MSDPIDRRNRPGEDDGVPDKRPDVAGTEPERARVYDRPRSGGRSTMSWILIAIVVIALLLWLVF